jgi:hypothetical protein
MLLPLKRAALRFRAATPLASTPTSSPYYKNVVGQLSEICKKLMEIVRAKETFKYNKLTQLYDYYERRSATEGSFFITQNRC